jgi:hypothetical protein
VASEKYGQLAIEVRSADGFESSKPRKRPRKVPSVMNEEHHQIHERVKKGLTHCVKFAMDPPLVPPCSISKASADSERNNRITGSTPSNWLEPKRNALLCFIIDKLVRHLCTLRVAEESYLPPRSYLVAQGIAPQSAMVVSKTGGRLKGKRKVEEVEECLDISDNSTDDEIQVLKVG